jgi:hypothetical protein
MLLFFFCFGYIIPFSIKFVNINIFQIHQVRNNSVIILLPFMSLNSIFISLTRMFQTLEFHHNTACNTT